METKDFIKELEKLLSEGKITVEEKEEIEFDCAYLQMQDQTEELEETMRNFIAEHE